MDHLKAGFTYRIETIDAAGAVTHVDEVKNLIPTEGLNHIIDVALKNGTAYPTLYIGLYEGDYTPVPGDTMAAFPLAATELTAYVEATRELVVLGSISGGAVDNTASRAEFTGTTDGKLAKGGFVSTSPTKSSTTGVLLSAVRFPSPRPLDSGSVLRVTVGFSIVSL